MEKNKSYVVKVEEDPETGELLLLLPEEYCREHGWDVGDTIEWIDNHDGSWTLQKKEKPNG